jgi:hypothetical protein
VGGEHSRSSISRQPGVDETRANRLIATALLARDCAAVAPFDRSGHHAAVLLRADGNAAWAHADGGAVVIPSAIAVPPDLNIDLGHLQILGLGPPEHETLYSICS